MSRVLKFRAWGKNIKEYLASSSDGFNMEELSRLAGQFKNWKLEQYTGLKDRNGREIYEGDLIRQFDEDKHFVVEFEYGGFLPFTVSTMTFDADYCEVIGNVHENPELLEG